MKRKVLGASCHGKRPSARPDLLAWLAAGFAEWNRQLLRRPEPHSAGHDSLAPPSLVLRQAFILGSRPASPVASAPGLGALTQPPASSSMPVPHARGGPHTSPPPLPTPSAWQGGPPLWQGGPRSPWFSRFSRVHSMSHLKPWFLAAYSSAAWGRPRDSGSTHPRQRQRLARRSPLWHGGPAGPLPTPSGGKAVEDPLTDPLHPAP
jgi:hypothetical protein